MWGEPDRARTLMTDSIHVASWTTTRSDTQTTIRQQKYAHASGRLGYAGPEISKHIWSLIRYVWTVLLTELYV